MAEGKAKNLRELKITIEKAERQIANDDRYTHIDILGLGNQNGKNLMDSNDIDGAASQARKNYAKKQEFLKYGVKN